MRIRTIKPEFWRHPVLGRLDPFARLLALALLNYADDHGYFLADPALIRGECMPFTEDSVSIHGALITLENVGWIELSEGSEMGSVGRIKKFSNHQVVNRPTDSRLISYFNSVRTHGGLSEDSLLDKDKDKDKDKEGNRDHGRRAKPPDEDFLSACSVEVHSESPELREAWREWQEYRQSRHHMTGVKRLQWSRQAARLSATAIVSCVQFHGISAVCNRITAAITGNWQGLNLEKLELPKNSPKLDQPNPYGEIIHDKWNRPD